MPETSRSDQPTSSRRIPRVWALVGLVTALFGTIIGLLLYAEAEEPKPPFLLQEPSASIRLPAGSSDGKIHIAGSGSNIPLTKALLAAQLGHYHDSFVVHPSIGTQGGLRALREGAIDVAMSSRPLRGEEAEGLWVTPFARVPVVVAAHPGVPGGALSSADLIEIYAGRITHWRDGTEIVVLLREPGDSSHQTLEAHLPRFRTASEEAYLSARWRVLYHDAAMLDALEVIEGAVGLHGGGLVPGQSSYRILPLDGQLPSSVAIASGSYPWTKDLAFVSRERPTGRLRALVEFARSEAGKRLIESYGGWPLLGEGV